MGKDELLITSETAYAVDREGKIVAWNQAAARTFGHAESEALGKRCWELLCGRDVFDNQSCCEGCPVRASAFNGQAINPFRVAFKTAANERKQFNVSTLMLFTGGTNNVFVHLCRPESDSNESTTTHAINHFAGGSRPRILTARQTEVLGLLHKGMTVPQIADAMGISAATVRNHTQHILSKLRVHSRFEAVARGRRLKLI